MTPGRGRPAPSALSPARRPARRAENLERVRLEGSSALQEQWTERVRARWAARRAAASETGANDGAWLDGDAAAAIACDAAMAPVVTGDVDVDALEDLVRLCVDLDARRRDGTRDAAWAALEQAVIGKTANFLQHSQHQG